MNEHILVEIEFVQVNETKDARTQGTKTMLQKVLCVALIFGVLGVGLLEAQTGKEKEKPKEKPKEKETPKEKVKAKLLSVDLKKSAITVEIAGKKSDMEITKDVVFKGPNGGKADKRLKDDRMVEGAILGLVMEGKMLKEIYLPFRTTLKEKEKAKEKEKEKVKEKAK